MSSPILILGSGRSGTTWLLDNLADANALSTVFEPLHPYAVPEAFPWAYRYLRNDTEEPALLQFMTRVFSGRLDSMWTRYRIRSDRLNPSFSKLLTYRGASGFAKTLRQLSTNYKKYKGNQEQGANGIAVKCIRANLMLEWLTAKFDVRVIYLIRHPGAVAISKLNGGGEAWALDGPFQRDIIERYRNDRLLETDYLFAYKDYMAGSLTPLQWHTVLWCIDNALPLRVAARDGHCVVFYESLLTDSQSQWERIGKCLALSGIPHPEALTRASQQTLGDRTNDRFSPDQVNRWIKTVAPAQLAQIQEVLDVFSITCYRAASALPVE